LTAGVPDPTVPFAPLPESVGAARRYAVQGLDERGLQHLRDDVRTIVSELATNAVLHARTPFTVSLAVEPAGLRVAVTDGSPAQPRLRRRDDDQATTGRGLRMVAELSTSWGVEASGAGKTTWCYVEVAQGGTRELGSRADSTSPAARVEPTASSTGSGAPAGSAVTAAVMPLARAAWGVAA
jgi:anti-sigma regulatory factor (Ser/Thr protein kinase)